MAGTPVVAAPAVTLLNTAAYTVETDNSSNPRWIHIKMKDPSTSVFRSIVAINRFFPLNADAELDVFVPPHGHVMVE